MKHTQQIDVETLSDHRAQVIDCLIFPKKTVIIKTEDRALNLAEVVRQSPEQLKSLGLIKESVFSPTCLDPVQGSWVVGAYSVWIDSETSKPIDARTVKVLDRLPEAVEKLPLAKLIDLLAPTYLRSRVDAEMLVRELNRRGPSSTWAEQS